ncbi:MAG: ABC transporter permease [Candidatus Methanofastidiosia archaeon]
MKIVTFIKRDFRIMFTYKFAMVFNYMNMLFNLLIFILFVKMFGIRFLKSLEGYGGDVISYIILGTMGWSYLWSAMGAASQSMRKEMSIGTFEPIFLTPTSPLTIVIAYTTWGIFMSTLSIALFLGIAISLFDVRLNANYLLTFTLLILSLLMMIGFGLMIAGLNVYVKQVGAVVSIFQRIAYFLCGVLFPISVFPSYIQTISKILPFYYAIKGLRLSLMVNPELDVIFPYIIILFILSAVSLVSGIHFFKKGLDKARKEGSLAYY